MSFDGGHKGFPRKDEGQGRESSKSSGSGKGADGALLIVRPGRTLSAEEAAIANRLVAEGRTVEALAESSVRTADFLVDGIRTELTSVSNVTSPDPSGALARRILEGAGQAPNIIVDLRQQAGMTQELSQRAVRRAYGADGGRIQNIRVIGQDFESASHESAMRTQRLHGRLRYTS